MPISTNCHRQRPRHRCSMVPNSCITGLLLLLFPVLASAQVARLNYDPSGNLVGSSASFSSPPVILSGPQSRTARPGDSRGFSASVSGAPPLVYQWLFNGASIPNATNDSYVIAQIGASDFGAYSLLVADSLGAQTTSPVAQLQLDSDGDGLADSWEIANFGSITNQNALMDFDRDGNSNLAEFQDGTSPTNSKSLLPRLLIRAFYGGVLVSPDSDHYNLGDTVALQAIPTRARLLSAGQETSPARTPRPTWS